MPIDGDRPNGRQIKPETVVWWLTVMAASGITAVLPVLPLYVQGVGGDIHFIGTMMAAYWAANLISLPIGGWLSDHWGRRPVMVAGLLAYALASAGFLLLHETWFFALLRGVEGVAGACFMPAALAYVADRAPAHQQGQRIAGLAAAENAGILVGPILGGALASQLGLGSVFVALTVLCLFGLGMTTLLPDGHPPAPAKATVAENKEAWRQVDWILAIGLSARSLGQGFSMGMIEVIWPLFLTGLGGTLWHVTASWTVFAVPSLLFSRVVGRMIDRHGAGRPAVFGTALAVVATLSYPLAPGAGAVIALSLLEGVGSAFAYPGQNALMIQIGPPELRGRVIGGVTVLRTVGAVIGALLSPGLFALSPGVCFGTAALLSLAGLLALAIVVVRGPRPSGLPPGSVLDG